jgi:hypothetical protein
VECTGYQPRRLLVHTARVPRQQQRCADVPDVGDQSTPVTLSRMKLRSMTPFDDVSEVKCMVLPFGIALFKRSRRHLRLSPDREHEWEHPHSYCVHGSHLLA